MLGYFSLMLRRWDAGMLGVSTVIPLIAPSLDYCATATLLAFTGLIYRFCDSSVQRRGDPFK